MTIIKAKDFNTRQELDIFVKGKYGANPSSQSPVTGDDVRIEGTRKQLARLRLSGTSTFYGIPCKELDPLPVVERVEKVNRGKQTNFGEEGSIKNNPNI